MTKNTPRNARKPATSARATKKARLTDEQKKQNHIGSERHRRQEMRKGYERLAVLVGRPGEGRKEAAVLTDTVDFLQREIDRKMRLKDMAMERGMSEKEFESYYEQALKDIENRPKGNFKMEGGTIVSEGTPSSTAGGYGAGGAAGGDTEMEGEEEAMESAGDGRHGSAEYRDAPSYAEANAWGINPPNPYPTLNQGMEDTHLEDDEYGFGAANLPSAPNGGNGLSYQTHGRGTGS
ncbi:hypothetical protein MBLNU230_g5443t1 [Neophaeotheca triangularis]